MMMTAMNPSSYAGGQEMTVEARQRVEDYLGQVRASLWGCKTVDADDVARDVREHIEAALHDVPSPVGEADVRGVLARLGSPYQWVPVEELPWWRRFMLRLRTGTEDHRLVYLSFGLLVAGLALPVFIPAMLIAAFVTARVALSLAGGPVALRAYRWMLYPQLLLVYVPLTFVLLVLPSFLVVAGFEDNIGSISARVAGMERGAYMAHALIVGIAAGGAWWALLGAASFVFRRAMRGLYYPFASRWGWVQSAVTVLLGTALLVPFLLDDDARRLVGAVWDNRHQFFH